MLTQLVFPSLRSSLWKFDRFSGRAFPGISRILSAALFVVAVLLPATTSWAAPEAAKNILLMISDDQGLDLGCYGNQAVTTPNIDGLAAGGARFTQAFAAVSSCSPSRATILTGMYNHASGQYGLSHGAHNQKTRNEVPSLPRLLGENGYRTGIIGKYHLAPDTVYPFDTKEGGGDSRNPEALKRRTKAFIESAAGKPFFLVVGFSDPHRAGSVFPGQKRGAKKQASQTTETLAPPPPFLTDLPEVREDYAGYRECVNNLDRCAGAVLGALDESGATSSTLVIFLSDNGIPFPGAKTNVYDAGIHLPLIIRAPGITQSGSVSEAMASWVDVAPTALEWAGIKVPRKMHGKSLIPVLKDPASQKRDVIFASHTMHEITMYYPMRAVRTRDFKLIWNLRHELTYPVSGDIQDSPTWLAVVNMAEPKLGGRPLSQYLERPEFELYDLRQDKHETRNLAGDPEHEKTLAELKQRLFKMMNDTGDPWRQEIGRK